MSNLGPEIPLPFLSCGINSSKLLHRTSEDKVGRVGHRRGTRFSSFSSAQDLRCFQMEKEKDDDTSPRGVLEACIRGSSDLEPCSLKQDAVKSGCSPLNPQKPSSRWLSFFKLWKKSKQLPPIQLAVPKASKWKSKSLSENVDGDLCHLKSSWTNFTLSELQNATNNFSQENLIGKGGYAEVFRGCLPDGQHIAVKRMNNGTSEDQIIGFLSEIGTIAHVQHPNTAKLVGFGVEGGTYLVLQLSPNGSLGSLLRGPKEKLDWAVRYKIIQGTATGLLYLHENCRRRIIHRDIKADNILLTEDFVPQICDFGLAKWLPKEWTHHNIPKFEGTFGYFAPEYFMHGVVDEKTDVFSFGVLLLVIITGREALDDSQKSLVIWAKPLLEGNNPKELIDPSLGDNYDPEEMEMVMMTASLCIDPSPVLRPRMSQVAALLRGENYKPEGPKERQKRMLQRSFSEELFDVEEYNSTKYLRDMNRHKEVALGILNQ